VKLGHFVLRANGSNGVLNVNNGCVKRSHLGKMSSEIFIMRGFALILKSHLGILQRVQNSETKVAFVVKD